MSVEQIPASSSSVNSSTMASKASSKASKRPTKRPHAELEDKGPFHATNGMLIPDLSADNYQIYRFAPPRITNFPDISASRRAEKARLDKAEAAEYVDDGQDDWDEFAGSPEDYKTAGEGRMARCIASVFMQRAKRAYRAGRTWRSFEDEELAIDTQAAARAESDARKRKVLLAEALCGKSRLEVFDQIKERLCTEIFLEHYDETRLIGREDSIMALPPPVVDEIPEREKEKSVAGWSRPVNTGRYQIVDGRHGAKPRLEGHYLPLSRPQFNDDDDETTPATWAKPQVCSNCGTDRPNYLEDPRCPQCKTVEEDVDGSRDGID